MQLSHVHKAYEVNGIVPFKRGIAFVHKDENNNEASKRNVKVKFVLHKRMAAKVQPLQIKCITPCTCLIKMYIYVCYLCTHKYVCILNV